MKKRWEEPKIVIQQFMANEYVAACIVGTIQCALPGRSPSEQDDGTDVYKDSQGLWHGLCGNDASISFASGTGTGYEVKNGVKQMDRPIYEITGYEAKVGTYNNVTWKSNDGTYEYTHTGRLRITNIDENRPNHS